MRRYIAIVSLAALLLIWAAPLYAVRENGLYLYDDAGLLSAESRHEINEELRRISARYGCDVVAHIDEKREYTFGAAGIAVMLANQSYGITNGILFFYSPDKDVASVAYAGRFNDIFTSDELGELRDRVLAAIRSDGCPSGLRLFAKDVEARLGKNPDEADALYGPNVRDEHGDPGGAFNLKWGMSRAQIKRALERSTVITDSSGGKHFDISDYIPKDPLAVISLRGCRLFGYDVNITFRSYRDRLYSIEIGFPRPFGEDRGLAVRRDMLAPLLEKYGEPDSISEVRARENRFSEAAMGGSNDDDPLIWRGWHVGRTWIIFHSSKYYERDPMYMKQWAATHSGKDASGRYIVFKPEVCLGFGYVSMEILDELTRDNQTHERQRQEQKQRQERQRQRDMRDMM